MFIVSKEALSELSEYFEDKDKQPIRVFMASGGCSGTRLAMSIDEVTPEDATSDVSEFTFCVKKELFDLVGTITIDYTDMGFVIETEKELPTESGGCGSCGSGCK